LRYSEAGENISQREVALNHDAEKTIRQGDRIAQLVIHKCEDIRFDEVGELSETERGLGGFGSSGR